jgi:hypothetical protein
MILLCAPGSPASIACDNTYVSVATRIAIQKVFGDAVSTNTLSLGNRSESRAKRSPGSPGASVRLGVFEADLKTGELRKNGVKVPLQGQPFQVCALLLERAGELVTREGN